MHFFVDMFYHPIPLFLNQLLLLFDPFYLLFLGIEQKPSFFKVFPQALILLSEFTIGFLEFSIKESIRIVL